MSKHLAAIPPPLACYLIAQQHTCLVRPSLTNAGEQRGRDGLANVTISSQVACDHRKVLRAELVSTPPDGLDTLRRSNNKVRKRYGTWHNKVTVYGRTYAHTSNRTYSHIRPCVDPCVHPYVTHRKHTPVRKIT